MPIMTAPGAPEVASTAPVVRNPFVRAAFEHEQPGDDRTTQMLAGSSTRVGPLDVPAYGFMRNIVIDVVCSGGVGGTPVLAADGPWNILESVSLEDVGGRPIIGPLSGYELYLLNKWGGYRFGSYDPALYPSYVATAMNPSFQLIIPVEITPRDAIGSLPNLTSSQTYKVSYTIAAGSAVYTTAPTTTLPAVRVRLALVAWSQPPAADVRGIPNETEPPFLGTTQYAQRSIYTVNAGENRIALKRVGNLVRNLILIYRTTAGARNDGNLPATYRWELDSRNLEVSSLRNLRDVMFSRWGMAADTGVVVRSMTHDGDGRPGNEQRHLYLPTSGATRLEFIGSFAAAGTLTVITNDVAPAGGVGLSSGGAA